MLKLILVNTDSEVIDSWEYPEDADVFHAVQRYTHTASPAHVAIRQAEANTRFCDRCGDPMPEGQSCMCFDNHCQ